jgi:hypothetical protein
MKRTLGSMSLVASLTFASVAEAQVTLDFKVAYEVPSGDLAGGTAMSRVWAGAIPLEVAGRYHFTPSLCVPSLTGCDTTSGYDMRTGVEAVFEFLPGQRMNPWLSLGTGWEWTHFSLSYATTPPAAWKMTYNGWEYFNVQVGADVALSRTIGLGPYVGFFGGSYTSGTSTTNSGSETGRVQNRAFHGWWQFGIRCTVGL